MPNSSKDKLLRALLSEGSTIDEVSDIVGRSINESISRKEQLESHHGEIEKLQEVHSHHGTCLTETEKQLPEVDSRQTVLADNETEQKEKQLPEVDSHQTVLAENETEQKEKQLQEVDSHHVTHLAETEKQLPVLGESETEQKPKQIPEVDSQQTVLAENDAEQKEKQLQGVDSHHELKQLSGVESHQTVLAENETEQKEKQLQEVDSNHVTHLAETEKQLPVLGESETEQKPKQNSSQESKYIRGEQRIVRLHVLCPTAGIGAVLGKGHSNIQRLARESSAEVSMTRRTGYAIFTSSATEVFEGISPTVAAARKLLRLCWTYSLGSYHITVRIDDSQRITDVIAELDAGWLADGLIKVNQNILSISSGEQQHVYDAFIHTVYRLRRVFFRRPT